MKQSYLKLLVSGSLAVYSFYYWSTINAWHFIDYVNLIIHEAGHIIFSPLGTLMMFAGGSILQIIVPLLFAFYFNERRQYFSAAVMLYWLAINFFNVAHYAADAVVMQLPLLGGDNTQHDWNNILSMLHALDKTMTVATIINILGVASVFFALSLSIIKWRERSNPME